MCVGSKSEINDFILEERTKILLTLTKILLTYVYIYTHTWIRIHVVALSILISIFRPNTQYVFLFEILLTTEKVIILS